MQRLHHSVRSDKGADTSIERTVIIRIYEAYLPLNTVPTRIYGRIDPLPHVKNG